MRRYLLPCLVVFATVLVPSAQAARMMQTTLTGAAEVPGPGDPDGMGSATIDLNVGTQTVCWTISTSGISDVTGAHIHRAAAGAAGPIVVHLTAVADGTSQGCTMIAKDLAKEINKDPAGFYVNVHSSEHPPGAIRGQLG